MDSTASPIRLQNEVWPPSHRIRRQFVSCTAKYLSSTPLLYVGWSYALFGKEEAKDQAELIESSAFKTANNYFQNEPHGDYAEQVYFLELSKLMVEADVKKGRPRAAKVDQLCDISSGLRAFIEADEGQQLLKLLSEASDTKICFRSRCFGLDAPRVAAAISLFINKLLTQLDLLDLVAGRSEAEALKVMAFFSATLEHSDLSCLNLSDNAIGEKEVWAFRQFLRSQCNLEELYAINNGISEEAAKAVCELIPSTKKLKVLHFHNNMIGDEGAVSVAGLVRDSPVLEDFRCSSTQVGSKGGIALSESLGNCTNLKKLDLRDNMYGVEAGIALSKSVPFFSNLTEVYLCYLSLEDEGTIALVNALKSSASALEVLEMAGNNITSEAAPALAACLTAKNTTLTKLVLSKNELKDEGAIVIANALKDGLGKLAEVDLSANEIRTTGARVLSQAVVGKPGFKQLNINGNCLSDEGVGNVKEIFNKFPSVLGPLDDNDPEGEEYDDDTEDELESKRILKSSRRNSVVFSYELEFIVI